MRGGSARTVSWSRMSEAGLCRQRAWANRIAMLIATCLLGLFVFRFSSVRSLLDGRGAQFNAATQATSARGLTPCEVCGAPAEKVNYQRNHNGRFSHFSMWLCPDHAQGTPPTTQSEGQGGILVMALVAAAAVLLANAMAWSRDPTLAGASWGFIGVVVLLLAFAVLL